MGRFFLSLCMLMGAIAFSDAMAHRLPVATFTVAHVDDGEGRDPKATQVTVRIHGEDALKVLREMGAPALSLDDAAIVRLVGYASTRMEWGAEAIMVPLGGEVDGNWVYLYWEGEGHVTLTGASLLSDISKDWQNQVTIISPGGERSSRAFHKGAKPPVHRHD